MGTSLEKSKFPRTPHLPISGSVGSEDLVLKNWDTFLGKNIIITEKMDGENITIYKDSWHVRSLDSRPKEYHSYLQNKIIPQVQAVLQPGECLVGEYLYRRHTIPYDDLKGFFYGIALVGWQESVGKFVYGASLTRIKCREMGIPYVPLLGFMFNFQYHDSRKLQTIANRVVKKGGEGLVIRNEHWFRFDDWGKNAGKFIRPDYKPGFGEGLNGLASGV